MLRFGCRSGSARPSSSPAPRTPGPWGGWFGGTLPIPQGDLIQEAVAPTHLKFKMFLLFFFPLLFLFWGGGGRVWCEWAVKVDCEKPIASIFGANASEAQEPLEPALRGLRKGSLRIVCLGVPLFSFVGNSTGVNHMECPQFFWGFRVLFSFFFGGVPLFSAPPQRKCPRPEPRKGAPRRARDAGREAQLDEDRNALWIAESCGQSERRSPAKTMRSQRLRSGKKDQGPMWASKLSI